jgi:hypothetical protein
MHSIEEKLNDPNVVFKQEKEISQEAIKNDVKTLNKSQTKEDFNRRRETIMKWITDKSEDMAKWLDANYLGDQAMYVKPDDRTSTVMSKY